MSDPRYLPAELTDEPRAFGRAISIRWKSDEDPDRIEASRLQHELAYEIRRAATAQFGSIKAYAKEAGLSYGRTNQVLNGRLLMRLEDVAIANRVLSSTREQRMAVLDVAAHGHVAGVKITPDQREGIRP